MITFNKEQLSQYNYSDVYDYLITELLLRNLPYEDSKIAKKCFDFLNRGSAWVYIQNDRMIIESSSYEKAPKYFYKYVNSIVTRTVKNLKK